MPYKMKKVDGYKVSSPRSVHAKNTSKTKARKQIMLLNMLEHGVIDKAGGSRKKRKKRHA